MVKECTCCGDVCIIREYKHPRKRNYSIYKVKYYRSNEWMYMMKVQDDEFPIPLTKVQVEEILSDPDLGATIASNHWLDRYR